MQKQWLIPLGAGALLAGGIFWAVARGRAQEKPAQQAETPRQELELTVYKEDFGLVREVRPMELTAGSNRLHVTEVSKMLDPQSVLLDWQGDGANLPQLVAHAYDLGVGDGNTLLKRYLGKEVEVVRYGENGHEAERQKGKLVVEGGGFVLESEGKFYVNPQGTVVAPTTPEVVPIPQLTVQAESGAAQDANLEVAYLTRGLAWSADYVATLDPEKDILKLEAWATVTNRTGADYPNAKVTLIAGTPNRAAVDAEKRKQRMGGASFADGNMRYTNRFPAVATKRAFDAPEAMGEFHAYPVKAPTTVVQEQMNRLLMLSSDHVALKRDYSARPPQVSAWDYGYWGRSNRPARTPVAVALSFWNKKTSGLGEPLPAGSLRFYEPDANGSLRYVGAATASDTPEDEKISATLSNAFDLFVESKQVKSEKVDKRTVRKSYELTLHNRKRSPVTIRVVQGFDSSWKVVSESEKHTKLDAYNIQWKVNVAADSKTDLKFAVNLNQ